MHWRGRDRTIAVFEELLTDISNGKGRIAVVSGDIGSGKTRLLDHLVTRATTEGMLCLSASTSAAERDVPLAAAHQLFEAPPLHPGPDHSPAPGTRSLVDRSPFQVWTAVLDACSRSPVVITLDDAHLADTASLELVTFLARRFGRCPVLVVLAEGVCESALPYAVRDEIVRLPGCRELTLSPLGPVDVDLLLEAGQPHHPRLDLANRIHHLSGGIPLLVDALLTDIRTAEHPGTALPPGPSATPPAELGSGPAYAHAVHRLLRGLGPDAVRVAQGLAVLEFPSSDYQLDRCLDLPPGSTVHTLRRLGDLALLDDDRPRPQVAQILRQSMRPSAIAELHRAAAVQLFEEHRPVDEVAEHLLRSGTATQEWQLRVVTEAATEALRRKDPHRAVSLATFGHRWASRSQQRPLLVCLVQALQLLEPARVSKPLTDLSAQAGSGHLQEAELIACLKHLVWHGRRDEALQVAGHLPDGGRHAGAPEALAWLRTMWPQDVAAQATDPAPCDCLVLLDSVLHGCGGLEPRSAEWTLAPKRTCGQPEMHVAAAVGSLILDGHQNRAADWLTEFQEHPELQGTPLWRSIFAMMEGSLALNAGDLPRSRERLTLALETIGPTGWGMAVGIPLSGLIHACSSLGDTAAVRHLLAIPVPDALMESPLCLPYLRARGMHRLLARQNHTAVLDLNTYADLAQQWGIDVPEFLPWRSDLARLALRRGDLRLARELTDDELDRLRPDQHRQRGITMRVSAMTRPAEDRAELLGQSLRHLDTAGARLESAVTLLQITRTRRLLGERFDAVTAAERAMGLASRCSATRLAAVIKRDPIWAPAHERGLPRRLRPQPLTDAEQRVAELAAQGHSNQQIARRFCITISTVEQHLTRVYRKLAVNRRQGLAAALATAPTAIRSIGPSGAEQPCHVPVPHP